MFTEGHSQSLRGRLLLAGLCLVMGCSSNPSTGPGTGAAGGTGGKVTTGTDAGSGGAAGAASSSGGSGAVAGSGGGGGSGVATGGSGGMSAGGGGGGGGSGGAGTGGSGGGDMSMIDAFNGDCSTARWAHVPQACWNCMCRACAATMNLADRTSMQIFECMVDKKLLVNNVLQLSCEQRAGQKECENGATAAWNTLVNFDLCLLSAPNKTTFRACDTECGTPYPGDVCTRYP